VKAKPTNRRQNRKASTLPALAGRNHDADNAFRRIHNHNAAIINGEVDGVWFGFDGHFNGRAG